MRAYYNEIDRYCCDWLQNLIDAGLITPGKIDDRSIADVRPEDVRGYERVHWFAGIAGWELALSLSEYRGHVWTGSCPCQPFSAAGKGKASSDERHLWPVWFELIKAVRPSVIFGEQVEAAIGWGWLDLVHSDLESEGYAIRSAVLPACSVGAPHIRQRLWFVAQGMADTDGARCGEGRAREAGNGGHAPRFEPTGLRADGSLADSEGARWGMEQPEDERTSVREIDTSANPSSNPWSDLIWLPCTDGKQRPTQPGIFPLASRLSNRVAQLRAAGNSIVPQVAAEFIKASY